ncbi:MAG: ParB/RepB/Spo0J family partition protein, partial [Pseudonocardiaceae bacterium]
MTITEIHPQPDHQPDQQIPVSVEAARDEELRWVDPRELILSDNVRTDAALDKGFIADVAERGVRQPVPVRRDESGRLVVRTGQRRVLAAIEAGLDRVRVLIEDEKLTDERAQTIDRLLDQLGENEHRSGLGEADEARATQQLLGLGLSARQIARRRHLPTKRVTTAAAVAQNQLALDAVTEGVLDLAQAAIVAEFTDDQAAVTTLTSAARTRPEQFSH